MSGVEGERHCAGGTDEGTWGGCGRDEETVGGGAGHGHYVSQGL